MVKRSSGSGSDHMRITINFFECADKLGDGP